MKKMILTALLAAALPAPAADVGVSIQISEPGVYGRIDIGRFPQPQVVVARPILVQIPTAVVERPEPIYMWVPPGHRKNWTRHCRDYHACGVPVYFVQDQWYAQKVKGHGRDDEQGKSKGHGNDKGKDKDKGQDKRD